MRIVALLVALVATPVAAEVQAVDADSFVIETVTTIAAPPDRLWATFRNPAAWWDREHTYSGDSANLYMDAQATGCFCEHIPEGKGSVEHGHIVYLAPGRMLRMTGALGPLQAEAVTGTLTFTFDAEGAGATKVTMRYIVGGHMRKGERRWRRWSTRCCRGNSTC